MPKLIAYLRFQYHGFLLDLNNCLNQLHLRSDEAAEEIAKKHVMTMLLDILPRLGYPTDRLLRGDDHDDILG